MVDVTTYMRIGDLLRAQSRRESKQVEARFWGF